MNLFELLFFMVVSAGLLALGHFLSRYWGTGGWLIGILPVGLGWAYLLVGIMRGTLKQARHKRDTSRSSKPDKRMF